jgi:hypothetical protein
MASQTHNVIICLDGYGLYDPLTDTFREIIDLTADDPTDSGSDSEDQHPDALTEKIATILMSESNGRSRRSVLPLARKLSRMICPSPAMGYGKSSPPRDLLPAIRRTVSCDLRVYRTLASQLADQVYELALPK